MAQFPPNLDDGELWLPSDIFLNEVPSKRGLHHFSCMDDLAQRLAALTILKQRSFSKPPFNTPHNRFEPVGPVQENWPSQKCFRQGNGSENRQRLYGYKLVPTHGDSDELFYKYQLHKPVHPKVGVFLETRARVFQKQQNHLLGSREKSGFGFGGFVRVSGTGTGVFHPRVLNNATTTSTAPSAFSSVLVKKKQVLRRRPEIQVPSKRNPTRLVDLNNEGFRYKLPLEMGLPQDWTY